MSKRHPDAVLAKAMMPAIYNAVCRLYAYFHPAAGALSMHSGSPWVNEIFNRLTMVVELTGTASVDLRNTIWIGR